MKNQMLFVAIAASMFAGSVMAQAQFTTVPQNHDVTLATAGGTNVTFILHYEDMGTGADAIGVDLDWNPNQLTYVSHSGAGCAVLPPATTPKTKLRHGAFDAGGLALPSGDKCSIVLSVNADNNGVAWADGDVATLTFNGEELTVAGVDHTGDLLPSVNGTVTIVTGPPADVVVTFTPASGGTVTFPGGMPADVVTQSIAIGNTGTIGSGTVSGCVLGGADAGSFAITGGNPSTVPPATSLDLSATLGAAALNATLTCNVADSGGASTATWTLTAPAGTVLAAPTLAANPASGTAITLPNSYGTPVSSNIVITPTGGDAGGPNASVTCSTASAGFTVTPAGALTFTPPGGAAQNAVVGCTPGAAAINGTVTCTGTDQAGAISWTYPVTCPAAQTAPPPPTFVPASSLWSKLALFGVFAALGMLILGLRRNH